MLPRPRWLRGRAAIWAILLCFSAARGGAQGSNSTTSAMFLLLPIGAQAAGLGHAMAAVAAGTEGVWWNAAALGWLTSRQMGIQHSQTTAATGDALTLAVPVRHGPVIGASLDILNFGEIQLTNDEGGVVVPVGVSLPRNFIAALTVAQALWQRVTIGASYKLVEFRVDCSGECSTVQTFSSRTAVADAGMQIVVTRDTELVLGFAARSIGLQRHRDSDGNVDPVPTRLDVGVGYRVRAVEHMAREASLHIYGDLVDRPQGGRVLPRGGVQLGWDGRVFIRGGYVSDDVNASGASLGVGIVAGALLMDVGRGFAGTAAGGTETPTYFSLRYSF